MPSEITNAVRARQTINPKTVLGFYATILGILMTATVTAVGVLAHTRTRTDLIPELLTFTAIVFVMLVAGVFVVTLIDPSKLMLTQVTGTEYAEIRRAVIGDSSTGDRIEIFPPPIEQVEAIQPATSREVTSTPAGPEASGE